MINIRHRTQYIRDPIQKILLRFVLWLRLRSVLINVQGCLKKKCMFSCCWVECSIHFNQILSADCVGQFPFSLLIFYLVVLSVAEIELLTLRVLLKF